MNYKWKILQGEAKNLTEILSAIAKCKKMSKEDIKKFINNDIQPHNPFLLTNMDKAVDRINQAIKNNEKIQIIGDYDCDGICATSLLFIGLSSIYSNVSWKLPHRTKDGYGLNINLINEAQQDNVNLIITVDNGIAAHEPINHAKDLDIDVIVTDHHQLNSNGIPTKITVNPHQDDSYPFKNICGCMVAFKLVNALIPDLHLNEKLYNELIVMVALATVADVMLLVDENRYYVKKGLELLNDCDNLSLSVLIKKLELKNITAADIGYKIAPFINATGRLASADLAVEWLLTEDINEAEKITDKIMDLNEKRQELQKQLIAEIEQNNLNITDNFIILKVGGAKHGLIGIVAGNITEKYNKPCIILTQKDDILGGSGRSIDGYDIFKVIENNRDIVSGGGHAAACGVSIKEENLLEFKKRCNEDFNKWIKNNHKDNKIEPTKYITCEFPLNLINEKLINNINKLQPFGQGNYEPTFATIGVNVFESKITKNSNAMQFTFEQNGFVIKAIGFKNILYKFIELNSPKKIDIIYTVGFNEWNGIITAQLRVIDIRINF